MTETIARATSKTRMRHVLDYIFKHLDEETSISTLAKVAHYSPFHLQKLFKQNIGDTPKQYALKLRLETAYHLLIVNPHKAIQEIALETGFSSPAIFSRATKSYFGHSPQQLRCLPHGQQMKILHGDRLVTDGASVPPPPAVIDIIRKAPIKGIYILAPFDRPDDIRIAYQTLNHYASPRGWDIAHPFGILAPHLRNSYKAMLAMPTEVPDSLPFATCEVPGALYATFTVTGTLRQTSQSVRYFYHHWLPLSGYKIAGITGLETFSGSPADIPYTQLERKIHIPIELAG